MRREGDLRLVERLCDRSLRVRRHVRASWFAFGTSGVDVCGVGLVPLFAPLSSRKVFRVSDADSEDALGDW